MRTYEALSYRDNEVGLRVYRDGLFQARAEEIATLPSVLTRVYVRRVSRIVAGGVATIGFGAVAVAALLGNGMHAAFDMKLLDLPLTMMLLLTVAAVPVAALIARTAAQLHLHSLVRRDLRKTDDTRADVERLERPAAAIVAERADALETRSVAAPLVGLGLLAPLTLHFGVFLFMDGAHTSLEHTAGEFDWWICASLLLTGIAHVTLAAMGVRFAQRLRDEVTIGGSTPSVWTAYFWTISAGCIPGVILYLVPPVIVAATGIVFIPAAFAIMRARVRTERLAIDACFTEQQS